MSRRPPPAADASALVASTVRDALRLHPRLEQAALAIEPAVRARLASSLPPIVPFGDKPPQSAIAILDFDHVVPPVAPLLRLHLFRTPKRVAAFEQAYAARRREIDARDLFPEFDLPDFADLEGDESYEAELDEALAPQAMRLVSAWRRDLDRKIGRLAVEAAAASPALARLRAAADLPAGRGGQLEAVQWTPPCESGHPSWTVDVWWIATFDGQVGRGYSLLVDLDAPDPVVGERELTVRAG